MAPKKQTISPDLYEVVVTDDALADTPVDSLVESFPWVRHVPGPQKGPASNRNNGARAAQGEWLIFLDDVACRSPAFCWPTKRRSRKSGLPGFRGLHAFGASAEAARRRGADQRKGGYLWSCNFCIKQELFFEIGGFCELYPYACMEDVDFASS